MEVMLGDKENGRKDVSIIGIRFRPCGRVYTFDRGDLDLNSGDLVVVESIFGLAIGTVVDVEPDVLELPKELKKIIRKASEEDLKAGEANKSLEKEAREYCLERLMARGLPMKLVGTEATLDKRRIIFYFTADGRIDFRELVKDLASKFKTRIEMRQIGVRDEAKLVGGLGLCGRPFCCSSFLVDFVPISIKMAKEQALVLNTPKLSGVCGRLMCCLSYEYEGPLFHSDVGVDAPVDDGGSLCEKCPSTGSGAGGAAGSVAASVPAGETATGSEMQAVAEQGAVKRAELKGAQVKDEGEGGKEGLRRGGRRRRGKRSERSRAPERSQAASQAASQTAPQTGSQTGSQTASDEQKRRFKRKKGNSKYKKKKKKRR